MICENCGFDYPEHILSPMTVGTPEGATNTPPLCGICALELTNQIHGSNRTEFQGEQAEFNRQEAIECRKRQASG